MTPPGTVRGAARLLGYDSDLEFVFPKGSAISGLAAISLSTTAALRCRR